jgi:NAD(P)H-dependent FMN reductase
MLVFSASLRQGSINARLAAYAASALEGRGLTVDLRTFHDFDGPSYNSDVETASGMPPGPAAFKAALQAADAFVIVSPEYNFSVPGGLKNAIDWVSRGADQPFRNLRGLLMSASPGLVGGNRGLWALRVPLESLGAPIHPRMFSLAQALQAWDEAGRLADPKMQAMLDALLDDFVAFAGG